MTTQPQFTGIIGDTATVLSVMFGPRQLDHHVMLWRWQRRLTDATRRSAAVSDEVERINAAYRARMGSGSRA